MERQGKWRFSAESAKEKPRGSEMNLLRNQRGLSHGSFRGAGGLTMAVGASR